MLRRDKEMGAGIGTGLALATEYGPAAVSLFKSLWEQFRGSKKELDESSVAIAQAAGNPDQLRHALDTLKTEQLAANDRTEALARELSDLARAYGAAAQTIAVQQRWLAGLSLAVVLSIGLALGALLAR
jgi:uncharacterized protein YigA (DUF484 family)